MAEGTTRARLLSLLSEACELEHALACSYLYAAFSLKRDIAEGIDWRAQLRNRRWAGRIYHVAAQEMLHLGQAWNLLTAVGGTPYYARSNFPLAGRHYPLNVALLLRPLDLATLERFQYYESPANNNPDVPSPALPSGGAWPIDESFGYQSVGQLYGEIKRSFMVLDPESLFIGDVEAQAGEALTDFPDIVRVCDVQSALAAINMITEQGEGTLDDREDSHYGVFTSIKSEMVTVAGDADIARPVAENPYVRLRRDQVPVAVPDALEGIVTTEITDPVAVLAIDLFDDVYVSMLQGMAFGYAWAGSPGPEARAITTAALELMTTVIKPLGEAICLLPSGQPGVSAGPTFAMSRHTQLPALGSVGQIVFGERLAELAQHAGELADVAAECGAIAADQISGARVNLARISATLAPDT